MLTLDCKMADYKKNNKLKAFVVLEVINDSVGVVVGHCHLHTDEETSNCEEQFPSSIERNSKISTSTCMDQLSSMCVSSCLILEPDVNHCDSDDIDLLKVNSRFNRRSRWSYILQEEEFLNNDLIRRMNSLVCDLETDDDDCNLLKQEKNTILSKSFRWFKKTIFVKIFMKVAKKSIFGSEHYLSNRYI